MKFSIASIVVFGMALVGLSEAVTDCAAFTASCTASCQSSTGKAGSASCNDFSSSCSCPGTGTDKPDTAKGTAFCDTQKSSCCAGGEVDSFSCDTFSFSSQCICTSKTSLAGGPLLGKDESACVALIKKCADEQCKGKKVAKNTCYDPKSAVCQCEGEGAKNTANPNESVDSNFAAPLVAGSVIAALVLPLI